MNMNEKQMEMCLDVLQYRQELHDQTFHSDIYTLSKPRRLTHLVLHHCKYVAELFLHVTGEHYQELQEKGPQAARIERLTVDGLIICLSMANVCNKSLFAGLDDRKLSRHDAAEILLRNVGRLAKTVEDIDHMAQTNPLAEIMDSAAIMASCYINLYLHSSAAGDWSHLKHMFEQVEERLLSGERKNIHYDRLIVEINRRMEICDLQQPVTESNMCDD